MSPLTPEQQEELQKIFAASFVATYIEQLQRARSAPRRWQTPPVRGRRSFTIGALRK